MPEGALVMNLNRTTNIAALALAATLVSTSAPAQQYGPPNQPDYQPADQGSQDPPSRVARISVVNGNVSLEPAGVDQFSQAELNYPLTAGDRVYADNASMSELQTDGLAVRLGNGADLTLSSLTDEVAQFGLAQGSIRLRTRDLGTPEGTQATVEVDTPNGTILVERPGDIRVDSYPQDDTTVVTVSSGQVEITGPNLNTQLNPGQSLRLAGTNPVYTQALRLLPPDGLDDFDAGRERDRQQGIAASAQYVDPGMIGVADLGQFGDWNPNPDYGAVWFPHAVPAGWTPYSNGHWAWVAPWGWTWIEAESWGFAPFHYGRWAAFDGRWGWVPGPPPTIFAGQRPPRPVYSPALVAFVGGPRFSISVGFGGGSGAGVTAWFPLGPREAYQPWYHASPAYVNRVNVTNLYTRNVAELRNTYNDRTTNVYNTNVTNVTYINRPVATVAVAQRDFASGRGVAQSQHIRIDPATQRQLAQAPILPHPLVTPQAGAAAPQAPPRALPPNQNRPIVETRQGFERAGDSPRQLQPNPGITGPGATTQPGNHSNAIQRQPTSDGASVQPRVQQGQPVAPQIPTQARQPQTLQNAQPQPLQGNRTQQQPVQSQPVQAGGSRGGSFPQQRDHAPVNPAQAPVTQAPAAAQTSHIVAGTVQNPPASARPAPQPAQTPAPGRNSPAIAAQTAQTPQQYNLGRPIQRPPDAPRPLINRTEPQPAQPSFPAQQRAIQANDPGRPLGPQQVQNLRQGKPAGPPAQAEPTVHPPAAAVPHNGRAVPPPNAPQ